MLGLLELVEWRLVDARVVLEVIADYVEARNGLEDFDESGKDTEGNLQEQRLNEIAERFAVLIGK